MNISIFIKKYLHNLLYSGLFITLLVTMIEYLNNYLNLISFYAFFSGSFIIVNLFQYKHINNEDSNAQRIFLIHSIIGGIIWCVYAALMYIMFLYNYSTNNIIYATTISFILFTIVYLGILVYDPYKRRKFI